MIENALLLLLPDDERATIGEHSSLVHLSQQRTLYRAAIRSSTFISLARA